ncbi:MAG: type II toxin-antitoxin system RelE/ParE family toxin [Arenicellales bacterium]
MKFRWLPLARSDIEGLKEYYIEAASLKVAASQISKIGKAARLLQTQPYMGHFSANDTDGDVFEWHIPSTNYTIPYMIFENHIEILSVFDQRQKRPKLWN